MDSVLAKNKEHEAFKGEYSRRVKILSEKIESKEEELKSYKSK